MPCVVFSCPGRRWCSYSSFFQFHKFGFVHGKSLGLVLFTSVVAKVTRLFHILLGYLSVSLFLFRVSCLLFHGPFFHLVSLMDRNFYSSSYPFSFQLQVLSDRVLVVSLLLGVGWMVSAHTTPSYGVGFCIFLFLPTLATESFHLSLSPKVFPCRSRSCLARFVAVDFFIPGRPWPFFPGQVGLTRDCSFLVVAFASPPGLLFPEAGAWDLPDIGDSLAKWMGLLPSFDFVLFQRCCYSPPVFLAAEDVRS